MNVRVFAAVLAAILTVVLSCKGADAVACADSYTHTSGVDAMTGCTISNTAFYACTGGEFTIDASTFDTGSNILRLMATDCTLRLTNCDGTRKISVRDLINGEIIIENSNFIVPSTAAGEAMIFLTADGYTVLDSVMNITDTTFTMQAGMTGRTFFEFPAYPVTRPQNLTLNARSSSFLSDGSVTSGQRGTLLGAVDVANSTFNFDNITYRRINPGATDINDQIIYIGNVQSTKFAVVSSNMTVESPKAIRLFRVGPNPTSNVVCAARDSNLNFTGAGVWLLDALAASHDLTLDVQNNEIIVSTNLDVPLSGGPGTWAMVRVLENGDHPYTLSATASGNTFDVSGVAGTSSNGVVVDAGSSFGDLTLAVDGLPLDMQQPTFTGSLSVSVVRTTAALTDMTVTAAASSFTFDQSTATITGSNFSSGSPGMTCTGGAEVMVNRGTLDTGNSGTLQLWAMNACKLNFTDAQVSGLIRIEALDASAIAFDGCAMSYSGTLESWIYVSDSNVADSNLTFVRSSMSHSRTSNIHLYVLRLGVVVTWVNSHLLLLDTVVELHHPQSVGNDKADLFLLPPNGATDSTFQFQNVSLTNHFDGEPGTAYAQMVYGWYMGEYLRTMFTVRESNFDVQDTVSAVVFLSMGVNGNMIDSGLEIIDSNLTVTALNDVILLNTNGGAVSFQLHIVRSNVSVTAAVGQSMILRNLAHTAPPLASFTMNMSVLDSAVTIDGYTRAFIAANYNAAQVQFVGWNATIENSIVTLRSATGVARWYEGDMTETAAHNFTDIDTSLINSQVIVTSVAFSLLTCSSYAGIVNIDGFTFSKDAASHFDTSGVTWPPVIGLHLELATVGKLSFSLLRLAAKVNSVTVTGAAPSLTLDQSTLTITGGTFSGGKPVVNLQAAKADISTTFLNAGIDILGNGGNLTVLDVTSLGHVTVDGDNFDMDVQQLKANSGITTLKLANTTGGSTELSISDSSLRGVDTVFQLDDVVMTATSNEMTTRLVSILWRSTLEFDKLSYTRNSSEMIWISPTTEGHLSFNNSQFQQNRMSNVDSILVTYTLDEIPAVNNCTLGFFNSVVQHRHLGGTNKRDYFMRAPKLVFDTVFTLENVTYSNLHNGAIEYLGHFVDTVEIVEMARTSFIITDSSLTVSADRVAASAYAMLMTATNGVVTDVDFSFVDSTIVLTSNHCVTAFWANQGAFTGFTVNSIRSNWTMTDQYQTFSYGAQGQFAALGRRLHTSTGQHNYLLNFVESKVELSRATGGALLISHQLRSSVSGTVFNATKTEFILISHAAVDELSGLLHIGLPADSNVAASVSDMQLLLDSCSVVVQSGFRFTLYTVSYYTKSLEWAIANGKKPSLGITAVAAGSTINTAGVAPTGYALPLLHIFGIQASAFSVATHGISCLFQNMSIIDPSPVIAVTSPFEGLLPSGASGSIPAPHFGDSMFGTPLSVSSNFGHFKLTNTTFSFQNVSFNEAYRVTALRMTLVDSVVAMTNVQVADSARFRLAIDVCSVGTKAVNVSGMSGGANAAVLFHFDDSSGSCTLTGDTADQITVLVDDVQFVDDGFFAIAGEMTDRTVFRVTNSHVHATSAKNMLQMELGLVVFAKSIALYIASKDAGTLGVRGHVSFANCVWESTGGSSAHATVIFGSAGGANVIALNGSVVPAIGYTAVLEFTDSEFKSNNIGQVGYALHWTEGFPLTVSNGAVVRLQNLNISATFQTSSNNNYEVFRCMMEIDFSSGSSLEVVGVNATIPNVQQNTELIVVIDPAIGWFKTGSTFLISRCVIAFHPSYNARVAQVYRLTFRQSSLIMNDVSVVDAGQGSALFFCMSSEWEDNSIMLLRNVHMLLSGAGGSQMVTFNSNAGSFKNSTLHVQHSTIIGDSARFIESSTGHLDLDEYSTFVIDNSHMSSTLDVMTGSGTIKSGVGRIIARCSTKGPNYENVTVDEATTSNFNLLPCDTSTQCDADVSCFGPATLSVTDTCPCHCTCGGTASWPASETAPLQCGPPTVQLDFTQLAPTTITQDTNLTVDTKFPSLKTDIANGGAVRTMLSANTNLQIVIDVCSCPSKDVHLSGITGGPGSSVLIFFDDSSGGCTLYGETAHPITVLVDDLQLVDDGFFAIAGEMTDRTVFRVTNAHVHATSAKNALQMQLGLLQYMNYPNTAIALYITQLDAGTLGVRGHVSFSSCVWESTGQVGSDGDHAIVIFAISSVPGVELNGSVVPATGYTAVLEFTDSELKTTNAGNVGFAVYAIGYFPLTASNGAAVRFQNLDIFATFQTASNNNYQVFRIFAEIDFSSGSSLEVVGVNATLPTIEQFSEFIHIYAPSVGWFKTGSTFLVSRCVIVFHPSHMSRAVYMDHLTFRQSSLVLNDVWLVNGATSSSCYQGVSSRWEDNSIMLLRNVHMLLSGAGDSHMMTFSTSAASFKNSTLHVQHSTIIGDSARFIESSTGHLDLDEYSTFVIDNSHMSSTLNVMTGSGTIKSGVGRIIARCSTKGPNYENVTVDEATTSNFNVLPCDTSTQCDADVSCFGPATLSATLEFGATCRCACGGTASWPASETAPLQCGPPTMQLDQVVPTNLTADTVLTVNDTNPTLKTEYALGGAVTTTLSDYTTLKIVIDVCSSAAKSKTIHLAGITGGANASIFILFDDSSGSCTLTGDTAHQITMLVDDVQLVDDGFFAIAGEMTDRTVFRGSNIHVHAKSPKGSLHTGLGLVYMPMTTALYISRMTSGTLGVRGHVHFSNCVWESTGKFARTVMLVGTPTSPNLLQLNGAVIPAAGYMALFAFTDSQIKANDVHTASSEGIYFDNCPLTVSNGAAIRFQNLNISVTFASSINFRGLTLNLPGLTVDQESSFELVGVHLNASTAPTEVTMMFMSMSSGSGNFASGSTLLISSCVVTANSNVPSHGFNVYGMRFDRSSLIINDYFVDAKSDSWALSTKSSEWNANSLLLLRDVRVRTTAHGQLLNFHSNTAWFRNSTLHLEHSLVTGSHSRLITSNEIELDGDSSLVIDRCHISSAWYGMFLHTKAGTGRIVARCVTTGTNYDLVTFSPWSNTTFLECDTSTQCDADVACFGPATLSSTQGCDGVTLSPCSCACSGDSSSVPPSTTAPLQCGPPTLSLPRDECHSAYDGEGVYSSSYTFTGHHFMDQPGAGGQSFAASLAHCSSLGGWLPAPDTIPRMTLLRELNERRARASTWLGATDNTSESIWQWTDGPNAGTPLWNSYNLFGSRCLSPSKYCPWGSPLLPQTDPLKNCLATGSGMWEDTDCNGNSSSLTCEFEEIKSHTILDNTTFYTVWRGVSMSVSETVAFCKDRGGFLPSLTSAEELSTLASTLPVGSAVPVGVTDVDHYGLWKLIGGPEARTTVYDYLSGTGCVGGTFCATWGPETDGHFALFSQATGEITKWDGATPSTIAACQHLVTRSVGFAYTHPTDTVPRNADAAAVHCQSWNNELIYPYRQDKWDAFTDMFDTHYLGTAGMGWEAWTSGRNASDGFRWTSGNVSQDGNGAGWMFSGGSTCTQPDASSFCADWLSNEAYDSVMAVFDPTLIGTTKGWLPKPSWITAQTTACEMNVVSTTPVGGTVFTLRREENSEQSARSRCQSLGGWLAAPASAAEYASLLSLLHHTRQSMSTAPDAFWFGYSNHNLSPDEFRVDDGPNSGDVVNLNGICQPPYDDICEWLTGEPGNPSPWRRVLYRARTWATGWAAATNVTTANYLICQHFSPQAGLQVDGMTYSVELGGSYTRLLASQACQDQGGFLPTSLTQADQEALQSLPVNNTWFWLGIDETNSTWSVSDGPQAGKVVYANGACESGVVCSWNTTSLMPDPSASQHARFLAEGNWSNAINGGNHFAAALVCQFSKMLERSFSFIMTDPSVSSSLSYANNRSVSISVPLSSASNNAVVPPFSIRFLHAANLTLFHADSDVSLYNNAVLTVESLSYQSKGTCNNTHCDFGGFTISSAMSGDQHVAKICLSSDPVDACHNMTVTVGGAVTPTGLMLEKMIGNQLVLSSVNPINAFLVDSNSNFVPPTVANISGVDVVFKVEFPLHSGVTVTVGSARFHENRGEPLRITDVPVGLQALMAPGSFVDVNLTVCLSDGSFCLPTGGASPATTRCAHGAYFDAPPVWNGTATHFVVRGAQVSRLVERLIAIDSSFDTDQGISSNAYMSFPPFEGGWTSANGVFFDGSTMRLLDHCTLEVNTTQAFSSATVPNPLMVHITGHPFAGDTYFNETVTLSDSVLRAPFSVTGFEQLGRKVFPVCPAPIAEPRHATIQHHAVAFVDAGGEPVFVDNAVIATANATTYVASIKEASLSHSSVVGLPSGIYNMPWAADVEENAIVTANMFSGTFLNFFLEVEDACCLPVPTGVSAVGCSTLCQTSSFCDCSVSASIKVNIDPAVLQVEAPVALNGTAYSTMGAFPELTAAFVGNASCNITSYTPTDITFGECDTAKLPYAPTAAHVTLLFNNSRYVVSEENFTFAATTMGTGPVQVDPVVHSISGCPANVFPSTGRCIGDGTGVPVTIIGERFNSTKRVTAVKFAHPVFPETSLLCEDLRMLNDTHLVCHYYRGFGSGFEIELIVGATSESFRSKSPTFSFRASLGHLCPVSNVTGAKCGLGTCSPVLGQCNCTDSNATGVACDTCRVQYFGSQCQHRCIAGPNGQVCSGNGECDGLLGNGTCQCYKGFAGADCSIICQGGALNPCWGHGSCSKVDGSCTCNSNSLAGYWSGGDCSFCTTGYSGLQCNLTCPRAADTSICGGQGTCSNGVCQCNQDYCGTACETSGATCTACPLPGRWGATCETPCPSFEGVVCAGNGVCSEGYLGNGRCTCAAGYAGDSCEMLCPGGAASTCTGHGTCNTLTGVCACEQYWGNTSCNRQCPGAVEQNVCSGHGTCLEGSAYSGACGCTLGYTGGNCSQICPGGLGNPCSGHGICDTTGCRCLDNDQNGHYAGLDCSVCAAGWYGTSCNLQCPKSTNGVQCSNHGTCDPLSLQCVCSSTAAEGFWRGDACEICQDGFWGSTCLDQCPGGYCNPCNGHGACNSGINGTGICSCDHSNTTGYWYGAECGDCDEDHYANNCSLVCPKDAIGTTCGSGVCSFGVEGTGACICDPHFTTSASTKACDICLSGYFAATCEFECPGGAANPCSGHGTCGEGRTGNGLCVCQLGYSQSDCSVYCPVFDGVNCGHGVCEVNGTCTCKTNYARIATGTCGTCVAGRFGPLCRQCPTCVNGTCDDGIGGGGLCVCNPGYWGVNCDQRCPIGATSGLVCDGHGTCTANGTCTCHNNATAGFYVGSACTECNSSYASTNCTTACPVHNGTICNDRGRCFNSECLDCKPLSGDLDSAFCGTKCELSGLSCLVNSCPAGMWGTNCDQVCPPCESGGVCLQPTGDCACPRGRGGTTCQTQCDVSTGGIMCNGFGTCSDAGCTCVEGYFGSNCEFVCPGPEGSPCNGHGTCGTSGICECKLGFAGSACEFACPGPESNPCFGKGSCSADGSCQCTGNFGGDDCGSCVQGVAGVDCDIKCYGVTLGKECICAPGIAGPSCDIHCPGYAEQDICAGHGSCEDGNTGSGLCMCDANYYMGNCSQFCTVPKCQADKQMLNPVCSPDAGHCVCQDNLLGHFVGEACDTCKTFFWGGTCALQCACNYHGGCDRDTGSCQCFADDENGYWAGDECTECATGYIGIDCRGLNIELSENPGDTSDIAVQNTNTGSSIIFVDDMHNVTYVGGYPLMLLDSSAQPFQPFSEYPSGIPFISGSVIAMEFAQDMNSILLTVEQSTTNVTMVRISRGIPVVVISSTPLDPALFVAGRRMQTLAAVGFSVVASQGGDNGENFMVLSNAKLVVTDAADSLVGVFDINGLSTILSATMSRVSGQNSILVISGQDANNQWAVVTAPLPITVQPTFAVFDNTTVSIASCSAGAATCTSADLCRLERDGVLAANDVVYCGVQSSDGPMLIRVPYVANPSAASPGTGIGNLLVATMASLKFTALAFDQDINLGYVTFNFATMPTYLYKFSLHNLVPTGTYQFGYVGSDPEVVTSMMVSPENRELHCVIILPFKTKVVSLNLFGVKTVRPHIMDSSGNLTITVNGEGFSEFATPRCLFSNDPRSEVAATVLSSTVMTCVAPESTEGGGDCDFISFNVKFGTRRKTTTSNAPIIRPQSAQLERLITNFGGFSGSTHTAVQITVRGYGFVSSPYARCRLRRAGMTEGEVVMLSTFINSTAIICHQPKNLNVTIPPTRLAYAHDGATYSGSTLLFAITGTASGVLRLTPRISIQSDFVARIPPVEIHVVDGNENSMYNFDSPPYGQGPHPIGAEFLLGSLTFINATAKAAGVTSDGVVIFDALAVEKPKVGDYSMLFATPTTYRFPWLTAVTLAVTEGAPYGIEFLNGRESTRTWAFGATKTEMIKPEAMSIIDAAGNPIRDVLAVPSRMWVHYSNAYLRDPSDENSEIFHRTYDTSTGVRSDGTYQFPELPTRGVFGGSYEMVFTATGAQSLTLAISVEVCTAGTEYGKLNSFNCLRCPDHGICDGTPIVDVENGYWRSNTDSFVFYDCAPPYSGDSCGKGTCKEGYEGPRCAVCEPGYGKTGLTCTQCESQTTNVVLIVLVAIVIFGVLYLFVNKSIKTPAEFGLVRGKNDVLPIIFKILANHLQVCSKVGDAFVDVPPELAALFAGQSQASSFEFSFSFVACETKTNFYGTFIGTMIIPFIIVLFFAIVMVITSRNKKKHSDAELLKMRDEAEIMFESHKKRNELFGDDDDLGAGASNYDPMRQYLDVMGVSGDLLHAPHGGDTDAIDLEINSQTSRSGSSENGSTQTNESQRKKADIERAARHKKMMARMDAEKDVEDFLPKEEEQWGSMQISLVTAVIVMFLFYQTIIETCGKMLQCDKLDLGLERGGMKSYLTIDRSIECYTPTHNSYVALAIVLMIVVGLGLPILSVLVIKFIAKATMNGDIAMARHLFFFMTGGYKPSLWFWEAFIMSRKAVIVMITVIITDLKLRNYCAMWAIGFYFIAHSKYDPFAIKILTNLEMLSLLTILISLNIGASFDLFSRESTPGAYWTATVVVLGLNCITLLVFAVVLMRSAKDKLKSLYLKNPRKLAFLGVLFKTEKEEEAKKNEDDIEAMEHETAIMQRMILSTRSIREETILESIAALDALPQPARPEKNARKKSMRHAAVVSVDDIPVLAQSENKSNDEAEEALDDLEPRSSTVFPSDNKRDDEPAQSHDFVPSDDVGRKPAAAWKHVREGGAHNELVRKLSINMVAGARTRHNVPLDEEVVYHDEEERRLNHRVPAVAQWERARQVVRMRASVKQVAPHDLEVLFKAEREVLQALRAAQTISAHGLVSSSTY